MMNRRDFLKGILASAAVCCASGLVPETRDMSLIEADAQWSSDAWTLVHEEAMYDVRYHGYLFERFYKNTVTGETMIAVTVS